MNPLTNKLADALKKMIELFSNDFQPDWVRIPRDKAKAALSEWEKEKDKSNVRLKKKKIEHERIDLRLSF
jgi:hypothetical protein